MPPLIVNPEVNAGDILYANDPYPPDAEIGVNGVAAVPCTRVRVLITFVSTNAAGCKTVKLKELVPL